MNETATAEQEQDQSLSKKELVLAALADGMGPTEAAAAAGCTVPYASFVKANANKATQESDVPDAPLIADLPAERTAGVVQLDADTPDDTEDRKDPGLPSLKSVAHRIWPYTMERTGGRYRIGDERFEVAAKDAFEAADCFLIKSRGQTPEIVNAALQVWPALWRDYGARGRVITNMAVSAESAMMAMSAAKKYLDYAGRNA